MDAVRRCRGCRRAQRDDPTVPDADVGPDDAPVVEDHRVGDDGVERALAARVAVDCAIDSRIDLPPPKTASSPPTVRSLLDLDPQVGVAQADLVPDGRPVDGGVRAREISAIGASHLDAGTTRAPPQRRRRTSREAPGSKRCDVPDGMSSRNPWRPRGRSRSAALTVGQVDVGADLDRAVAGVDDHQGALARPCDRR